MIVVTDLELALDPETAPNVLEQLVLSRDKAVRLAVASNPNTPEVLLPRLAALYPNAVIQNPLLEWVRFLNPAWFEQLPPYALFALLGAGSCPTAWLEAAGRLGTEAQLAALRHPLLEAKLLVGLYSVSDARVADALAGHLASTSEGILLSASDFERNTELFKDWLAAGLPLEPDVLGVLAAEFDTELRLFVAMRSGTPEAILGSLALDEDEAVARAARAHGVTDFVLRAERLELKSAQDLNRLAAGQVRARRLAAQHGSISKKLLQVLSNDDDWRVRQDVALHPKTPMAVLARLATDYDRDVRCAVAGNPSTPAQVLEVLLADSFEDACVAARGNPNAPFETVRLLRRLETKDPALTDLESLPLWMAVLAAAHPNVSSHLLETFAKHEDSEVRLAVAKNPRASQRLLDGLLEDSDGNVVLGLLERPNLSDAMLIKLATHFDTRVTEALAAHRGLSKGLLEQLSADANWQVRRNVAAHPRCPIGILEFLAQDTDADVRLAAAHNPNANAVVALRVFGVELRLPQVLLQLEAHDLHLTADWLEFAARRGNDDLRLVLASHPNLPWAVMDWFLSQDAKIRRELARNSVLPGAFLKRLANDDDADVRSAIAAHLNTPVHLLLQLALDSDAQVRVVVAQRGLALDKLCWDEDDAVLACIGEEHLVLRRKLEHGTPLEPFELEPLLALQIPFVLQRLPATAHLPNLEAALHHELWQVRQAAARNLFCSPGQLEQLLSDTDRDVRAEIAKNPNVTPELLVTLLHDDDILVRRAALFSPHLEPSLRATAQRLILDESLRSSTLNRIAALALTTRISELSKRRNASSLEWRERLAVAKNPNTPARILELLSTDANRFVRAMALARLEGGV